MNMMNFYYFIIIQLWTPDNGQETLVENYPQSHLT